MSFPNGCCTLGGAQKVHRMQYTKGTRLMCILTNLLSTQSHISDCAIAFSDA